MNFGDGYDYEEIDRAYMTGKDDGGEQGYNIGYKEGYQDGIRAAGGAKAVTKTALSGWVRTADRVPTEADGDTHMVLCGWLVPSFNGNKPFYAYEIATKHAVCNNPEHHPLWHTLPPLPENAGAEGTKINGGE